MTNLKRREFVKMPKAGFLGAAAAAPAVFCAIVLCQPAWAQSAAAGGKHTVEIEAFGGVFPVEVGEIEPGDGGRPQVRLTSELITGQIGENIAAMFPVVPCAVLADGKKIHPTPLSAGVGDKTGYTLVDPKVLKQDAKAWEALRFEPSRKKSPPKGYAVFAFETKDPIADVIVGTYADYASGAFDKFKSSGASSAPAK
jgi:hypothetical protein